MDTNNPSLPSRVLHIDMPRALTSTARGFDFRNAVLLHERNVMFDHVDLNTVFWNCVLNRAEVGISLADLFLPKFNIEIAKAASIAMQHADAWLGFPITPFGIDYGHPVNASQDIQKIMENLTFLEFVQDFIETIESDLNLNDPNLLLVSIGVESAQSLVFGIAFSRCLKAFLNSRIRVILGKHSYENFSLVLRKSDVQANGFIESQFDHVIFHEEYFVNEISSLLRSEDRTAVIQLVQQAELKGTRVDEKLLHRLILQSRYVRMLKLPTSQCPILLPLSRNKCYWKKCSFCVQIKKHIADRYYDEHSELASTFAELKILSHFGFRFFIFNDEAIPPSNLRRLCDYLDSERLDIHWTVRIIADKNFKAELVNRMKQLGCFEVLFGLETVSSITANRMQKVSAAASEDEIYQLLKLFSDAQIGIFLNLIYSFPTESDSEFSQTFTFLKHAKLCLDGITTQINKFSLFYGTDIYMQPKEYGIDILEDANCENDLQISFDFKDEFGRTGLSPGVVEYFAETLDMSVESYMEWVNRIGFATLLLVFQLNYGSFGLIYKNQSGDNLFSHVMSK